MKNALTREAILSTQDITIVEVDVEKEWGGVVYVRLLSAGGRWAYLRGVRPVLESGDALTEDGVVRESGLRLAAATLCDPAGVLLFPDASAADLAALAAKAHAPMQRVIDAAADLNGFSARAVTDAKKNSPAETVTSASTTGSPAT